MCVNRLSRRENHISNAYRHPATGKFSAMKCVAGLIGRFDGIEFCVAASLSGQNVDVEEITETAKGVFENRPGQRAWRGFHKQTLLVRSCRAFLWNCELKVSVIWVSKWS